MLSRKTLILSVALAVAVTVPAVARAAAGPFDADPQPPTVGGEAETDAPYGWMGQMHDYMWNNGELPEDFPADAADWMNQMHDHMWGDTPPDGSYGWMGQMHDHMWGGGSPPAQIDPGSRSSNDSVPSDPNARGAAAVQPVPGPGWGGCGMRGGR